MLSLLNSVCTSYDNIKTTTQNHAPSEIRPFNQNLWLLKGVITFQLSFGHLKIEYASREQAYIHM